MEHNRERLHHAPFDFHHSAQPKYSESRGNFLPNSWLSFGIENSSASNEEINRNNNNNESFGVSLSSVKRQREHHVVLVSSQDDDDCDYDDNSMMQCDNDTAGPNKRRRFACAFPFDNDGRIIQHKREQINSDTVGTTEVEECAGMKISDSERETLPMEWWKRKRPLLTSATSLSAAINAKSIVEQESSPSSAMDTSVSDNEVRCHICQNSFPLPIIPAVREVMPMNALLNYFTPLNRKATSNGDVDMSTNCSHNRATRPNHHDWANSPASCPCCDRPSCPDCRRECQACQKSFCCFCSIPSENATTHCATSNSSFCLDCYDRLR